MCLILFKHLLWPHSPYKPDTVQELYDYVIILQVSKYIQTAQLYQHRQISDLKWHFVIDGVKSADSNTVDVELKTQLPHCYLCRSLYAIFSSSQEELYSRLKRENGKSPITVYLQRLHSHFLQLPPGRRKLHWFRQIRRLTKWEKDIIPFVLVEPIPCEV